MATARWGEESRKAAGQADTDGYDRRTRAKHTPPSFFAQLRAYSAQLTPVRSTACVGASCQRPRTFAFAIVG